jgi:cobalt-zinc-cadmium resistance protein CzcA
MPLEQGIREGADGRMRPVPMIVIAAGLALLPAARSTGIGSETQSPLAVVPICGLVTATTLTLLILPSIHQLVSHKIFKYYKTETDGTR